MTDLFLNIIGNSMLKDFLDAIIAPYAKAANIEAPRILNKRPAEENRARVVLLRPRRNFNFERL
jgi:hypothetical protein